MYTSAELLKKHLLFNLSGTLFLVLFGAVYESFSHGVYSYFMLYAFAIPLVFGVTLYAVLLYCCPDTWQWSSNHLLRGQVSSL